MAVTVDDLPALPSHDVAEMRRITDAVLVALRRHGVTAVGFVNADYIFDLLRRKAAGRGDTATVGRLRAAYVDYTVSVTEQMEALARETFGREVPQVLLVHANATNADALHETLGRLAGRGYRFVTLGEALADDAWRTPDEYVGPRGPSWLYRFRVAKGLPLGLEREPDPPTWVLDLYREAQR